MQLRNIDLNLLVILDALIREQSVTKAAARVSLSQPATSLALQRLRDMLDDPLLVRSGASMVLTPVAERLRQPIADILASISDTLAPQKFDAATSERIFRMTTSDHAEVVLLPALMSRMGILAPKARLIVQSVDAIFFTSQQVRSGEIDVVIGFIPDMLPDFHGQRLYAEEFVVIARKDHPAFRNGMTLDAFRTARHVLVSPRGGNMRGQVDDALQLRGMERFVALSVPRFSAIPAILSDSDLISTVPSRLAARPEWRALLDPYPLPLPVSGFDVKMFWHPRHDADGAHQWFRRLLADAAA